MPQLARLSPRHEAIIDWLIVNPEASLGSCAVQFGVTQAWLSTIIHSDIFQAKYQKLLGDYRDQRILPLRDKFLGLGHASLDKLIEKMAVEEDPKVLIDAASLAAKALGLSGGTTVNVNAKNAQINHYPSVTPAELAEAKKLYDAAAKDLPLPIEGESVRIPTEAPDASGPK